MSRLCVLLGLVCFALVVFAQAAPTSAPATREVHQEDVPRLYQQAMRALEANNPRDALNLLQQAEKTYPRGPKVQDAQHADVLHLLAVCDMKLNNLGAARPLMDRIAPLKSGDRAFVLNQAKLDIAARNTAMRAAKNLDAYLSKHDSPPDEDAINLLGAAIDVLASSTTNSSAVPALEERYRIYNSQLEATRRHGMRHWGQDWISHREWIRISSQRDRAQIDIDYADRQVKDWESRLRQAQADYDDSRRSAQLAGHGPSVTQQNAQHRITDAQKNVDYWTGKLKDAQSRMVRPVWKPNLDPVLPGSIAAAPPTTQPGDDSDDAPATAPKSAGAAFGATGAPGALSATGAQPGATGSGAGQPPAAFPSVQAVIATLPPDKVPHAGQDWSTLTSAQAGEWFQSNVAGRRITAQLIYAARQVGLDGTIHLRGGTPANFKAGAVSIVGTQIIAQLAPDQAAAATKLVEGQPITLEGEIVTVGLARPPQSQPQAPPSTPGAAIALVRLRDARVR